MKQPEPIHTLSLFHELDQKLINLLRSLASEEWEKQTLAPLWKIKDVAAHLLDGNIRALSMLRDNYFGTSPGNIETYTDLVSYLNGLNADWVNAMKRVSPLLLIELLELTGKQYCDYLQQLDLHEKATFSVAWAGEEESYNWFHIAREYTEKWHHQQQIRVAVGQEELLYSKKFYYPYLETSMRALPYHYRNVQPAENTLIEFTITGEGGGKWYLLYQENQWVLTQVATQDIDSKVVIPEDIAWRVFTKGIAKQEALEKSTLSGNIELCSHIFDMLAIMA